MPPTVTAATTTQPTMTAALRRFGALMAVDGDGRLRGVVTLEQVSRALQAHTAPTIQQIAPTSQQTAPTRRPITPTRRPMTPTTAPLNYVNKPKPSTTKPGLSVNAKPTQQTRTNRREPA